jgi:hypothetical protein
VNSLGELADGGGAAADLAEDAPGLELGVCPLAGGAQAGMGAVGLLLGIEDLPSLALLVRQVRPQRSPVAAVGENGEASGLQFVQDAPDPLGSLVMDRAGQSAGDPQDVAVRRCDDLQVYPVLLVLSRVERLVAGDPVDRDQRPVDDDIRVTCPFSIPDRLAELRRAGGEQPEGLVHVPPGRGGPDVETRRGLRERLALLQVHEYQQRLPPGIGLPPHGPDRLPVAADDPRREVQRLLRQRQRGTVKQHKEPLGGRVDVVIPRLPGASPYPQPRAALAAGTRRQRHHSHYELDRLHQG